jgi:hypothetical protein
MILGCGESKSGSAGSQPAPSGADAAAGSSNRGHAACANRFNAQAREARKLLAYRVSHLGEDRVIVARYRGPEQQLDRFAGGVVRLLDDACVVLSSGDGYIDEGDDWAISAMAVTRQFSKFASLGRQPSRTFSEYSNATPDASGHIAMDLSAEEVVLTAEDVNGDKPGSPSFREELQARYERSQCDRHAEDCSAEAKTIMRRAKRRHQDCMNSASDAKDWERFDGCGAIIHSAEERARATFSDAEGGPYGTAKEAEADQAPQSQKQAEPTNAADAGANQNQGTCRGSGLPPHFAAKNVECPEAIRVYKAFENRDYESNTYPWQIKGGWECVGNTGYSCVRGPAEITWSLR